MVWYLLEEYAYVALGYTQNILACKYSEEW